MSLTDVVKFSYCIAFSKDDYAKEFLESTEFFCSIEKIDTSQRLDLFRALKEKIKYSFDDDKDKKKGADNNDNQSLNRSGFRRTIKTRTNGNQTTTQR